MKKRLDQVITPIEFVSRWSGRLVAWLGLVLVLLICYDVAMRYLFNQSAVWMQELEWHLFAALFLLGMAYTLQADAHVRVDVFYAKMTPRNQALVNLTGSLLLLLPFCLLAIDRGWSFAYNSFQIHESSSDPGGLPARYIIKFAVPVGFTFLLLQGIAEALKSLLVMFHQSEPAE